jgi:Zn-dependent oligopeptidase
MDILKKYSKLSGEQILQKLELYTMKSDEVKNKLNNDNISFEQKIKFLIEDTFTSNAINSIVTLMLLIDDNINNLPVWEKAQSVIYKQNHLFNTDQKLYNNIIKLINNNNDSIDSYQRIFLSKLLKSMKKFGCSDTVNSSKISQLINSIDNSEDLIYNSIQKPLIMQINRSNIDAHTESIMSAVQPDKKNNMIIDKSRFYYLIKHIKNPSIRDTLESKYLQKYNDVIPNICKILILRHIYSNQLNYPSYYYLQNNRSNDENDNIKNMINDLNLKIDNKFRTVIQEISNNISSKRPLKINDIIFGLNTLQPYVKLKPVEIIQVIMLVMQRKFGLKFNKSKNSPINKYSNILDIHDQNNNLRGYLHLDLLKRNSKRINQLTLIKINSSFGSNVPNLYLLGNYSNLDEPIANYSDVVLLFREFGIILNQIYAYTPIGLSEDNLEMFNFTSELMEFIAYSPFVLNILVKDKNNIKKLQHVRYCELIINIKLKSLYILFDRIIHDSVDLINILNKTNDKDLFAVFLGLYNKCFNDIFNKHKDIIDVCEKNINPCIINNITNGMQCILYSSVLNMILAYNTYELLESDKNLDKFRNFLENKEYSYKKLIVEFIANLESDYYENFLIKCMQLKELNVINYFNDTETQTQTDLAH